MKQIQQFVGRLGLTAKLVILLAVFATIPMVLVGWIAFTAADKSVESIGQQFEYSAVNMADTIDRNLFERYGDVQAFGLNSAIFKVNNWYVPDEDKNEIIQVMNQYVDTYDIYFLTLLVDLKGRLIAVNTKDQDGKPIRSKALFANDYSQTAWFKALKEKSFTTKMPFTAPGNDVSTGTFIEDMHQDKDVQAAYPGKDGLVLGFSAPVYQNGQVVAYWSNRTKFSLVEEMIASGATDLKLSGLNNIEVTVLDGTGRVIVDFDPATTKVEKVLRDFNVLMKLNLADKNVAVAQKAVSGKHGYENALHARKQIVQASGYAHLKGAMGFPGMNWSILVRVPLDEAAASSREVQRNVLITVAACLLLILPLGFYVGKNIVGMLISLIATVRRLAEGDLTARSTVTTQDEVGVLAGAFNEMGENLQTSVIKQQEMATAAQAAAAEIKGITNAISKGQAVIEFNLDGTVITANDNFLKTLGYQLTEIQGHHHRMFCDPAYAGTGEYIAFWSKLNRGEFDAGTYKRLAKGGKEVWIQATYNPIMDANGKPYKVVKYAMDVTTQKNQTVEFEGKINAINKGQAVIEFNLDGTIITANDNFLNCLGYTLGEIKGQHHRMFCEPDYTSSSEYSVFWQKLNRGEFDAGAYKRIGKGGKEIWIQASYNPILDFNGKPYKVVKFATDITAQKKAQLEQEHLVGEAQQVLSALAEGDLTQQMSGTYQGELEKLKGSINTALANLTRTLTTVRTAAESVSTGAEQITRGNEDLSQRTSEQASSLEETSSAMEEMTSTVKQNADNAKQANQLAIAARDVAEKGGSVTTKAIDAMSEINKSSKKIADIITVIDEIAFQTNLLALNAAVEAARAGEHGRGFAVVAAEVRNLAQRSATAAKEIKGLINESVQRVTDGSELVDQSGKTLTEIVGSVKRVTDIIAEITAASQEQASGIDQVNKAIMQMDETTQQNAALVEEATSASQSMKEQAKELMTQVASFKINGNGSEGQARPGTVAHRPAQTMGSVKKPLFKKPAAPAQKPIAVGAGAAHKAKDEFEEF